MRVNMTGSLSEDGKNAAEVVKDGELNRGSETPTQTDSDLEKTSADFPEETMVDDESPSSVPAVGNGVLKRSEPALEEDTPTTTQVEASPPHERSVAFSMDSTMQESSDTGTHHRVQRRGGKIEHIQARGSALQGEAWSRRTSNVTKSGNTDGSKYISSLEIRRLPVSILLQPADNDDTESVLSDEFRKEEGDDEKAVGAKQDILHMLCLRPGYSLRTQLMLSFGTISALTIFVVVITCIIVAILAGNTVKDTSTQALEEIVSDTQALTARYLAESLSEEILLANAVKLIREATLDRFAGYPDASDDRVPFVDVATGRGKYPINMRPPPLEWDFETNVNDDNFEEHFQKQLEFKNRPVSTTDSTFFLKGICDPDETDPNGIAYWPNCTAANNDMMAGGAVTPANTTWMIYQKSKDLSPLLKSIFEAQIGIKNVGLFFANDGAGASISYPHYPLSTQSSYISVGCDWMNEPNFYDPSRPIGTPEMIARCALEDELVSTRVYSPMERGWCVDQALHPDEIRYDVGPDAWDNTIWQLALGQAVYDRITNNFIGCIFVGISLGIVDSEMRKGVVVDGEILSLLFFNDKGLIIGSSEEDRDHSLEVVSIYEQDLGMTQEEYERLYTLVDFSEPWDPEVVRAEFSNFAVRSDKYFVTVYPMPPVPETYDEHYEPIFMVVATTPVESVFGVVEDTADVVDDRVRAVNTFSIAAGAIGLAISFAIIFLMADWLTKPLRQMNKIASSIVDNFGDTSKDRDIKKGTTENQVSTEARCTPRTELSEVVKEFNKMVSSFSGNSMAHTERHKHREVYNMFYLHTDFAELYSSRGRGDFEFSVEPPVAPSQASEDDDGSIAYIHAGSNISDGNGTITTGPHGKPKIAKSKTRRSALFIWIVALIVTPLLVVNIIITAIALNTVSEEFTASTDQAKLFLLNVQEAKLPVHARLRADYVGSLTKRASADLHVLARYANWLLFGGMNVSDSFTELTTGIQECKTYNDALECPYTEETTVCDCAWQEARGGTTCEAYPNGSRDLQQTFWIGQSLDTDEDGNRYSHSYPDTHFSPTSTEWWSNQTRVPGWDSSAGGNSYRTTYDRLRVAAAIPLYQTLYNYHDVKDNTIATYAAFEADGLFMGYEGCFNAFHTTLKEFQSSTANGAADLRPELCPLGRFGYDPRCRGWYHEGRRLGMANQTFVHVTAPYEFATLASKITFAQSATSPLIDPKSGEHVGQVLLDFLPEKTIKVLTENTALSDGGFPILITTDGISQADTVVGPDYSLRDTPTAIGAKVQPLDAECVQSTCYANELAFQRIVSDMKDGLDDYATFYRTKKGGSQELLRIAYAPVTIPSLRPVDSSDFSRGVEASDSLVYSLALVESEDGILAAFDPVEEATNRQINVAIGILCVVLVVATGFVVYVSMRVSESIAEPMVYLLDLIHSIRKAGDRDKPDLRTVKASQEVVVFADSIEMLSTVVRSANAAFYAGELEVAYLVLVDALRLFKRLDNKKAIGIASNNLGNIMMGMYQEMNKENIEELAGLTKEQVMTKGIAYFHEAITLGEKAYDEFYELHGWTPICLDFMQHLSNRYFNRGLFLLSVKDLHEKPDEIEDLGRRDLQIAADMDAEVISYGEEIGWDSFDRVEKMFEVKIIRAVGYNLLIELGYKDDWEVCYLLEDAFDILKAEKKKETSALFDHLTYPGRMQEIEAEVMKYKKLHGDIDGAAKVAIRCLYEDERVFVDAESRAIEVLISYIESKPEMLDSTRSRIKNTLQDYWDMLEDVVNHQAQASVSELESDALTKATRISAKSANSGKSGSGRPNLSSSWSLRQSSGRFVTMEDF